jgi:hypothetical protein
MSDLERTFYTIGIIYMSLGTLFFIALFIFLWSLKRKIDRIQKRIKETVESITNAFGIFSTTFIAERIRSWFRRRERY